LKRFRSWTDVEARDIRCGRDCPLTQMPTVEQMEASLEGDRPQNWTAERTRQIIEQMNRP